ncbi:MAG: MarR family transcriptional regulator, partial [Candidatus Dormibacteria bacterium]
MEPDEKDESLAEAFWSVARRLRHLSREALAPWDVTPSQSRAVGVLARRGTMRLSELALHLR